VNHLPYVDLKLPGIYLIQNIHKSLTVTDKVFLLKFENATPDWRALLKIKNNFFLGGKKKFFSCCAMEIANFKN